MEGAYKMATSEEVINVAMQVLLASGDARNLAKEALEEAMNGDYEIANKKIEEANKNIEKAHLYQTEIIQREASGNGIEYSTLFTHAQDTMMTIYSEIHLAEMNIKMYKKLDERLKLLEEK